nr:RsmE family RNA methyltransferase [uncultured Selenomonas sp.]
MRRLFYAGELTEEIQITGADAHHLAHVMRARCGDVFVVAGAGGKIARMAAVRIERGAVCLRRIEFLPSAAQCAAEVILVQALLKGEKMDFVVQKAVELGAAELRPIITEHIVVRYDAKKAAAKMMRWQRIADEAGKQCGRSTLMHVAPIVSFTEFLADRTIFSAPDTEILFCYEREDMRSIRAVLSACTASRVVLIVGAEGGFSGAEAEAFAAAGAEAVSLGQLILRAETASITALAVTAYALGNLDI